MTGRVVVLINSNDMCETQLFNWNFVEIRILFIHAPMCANGYPSPLYAVSNKIWSGFDHYLKKISRNRVFFCCPCAATQGKTFQRLQFWVKPRVSNAQMVFSSEKDKNTSRKHTKIKRERSENDSSNALISEQRLLNKQDHYENEITLASLQPTKFTHISIAARPLFTRKTKQKSTKTRRHCSRFADPSTSCLSRCGYESAVSNYMISRINLVLMEHRRTQMGPIPSDWWERFTQILRNL